MKSFPRTLVALSGWMTISLATACSAVGAPASSDGEQSVHFSGAYAQELEVAYYESPSPFFREVIRDGVVTEAELAEAQSLSQKCVESLGFTDVEYFSDGGGSALPPKNMSEDEAHQKKAQCESEEGLVDIEGWYFTLLLNPDNLNWDEAIKDCLIHAQILDSGSSVDDMKQKMALREKSFESSAAKSCFNDPLGKLTKR